jgi:hypothetical protein
MLLAGEPVDPDAIAPSSSSSRAMDDDAMEAG